MGGEGFGCGGELRGVGEGRLVQPFDSPRTRVLGLVFLRSILVSCAQVSWLRSFNTLFGRSGFAFPAPSQSHTANSEDAKAMLAKFPLTKNAENEKMAAELARHPKLSAICAAVAANANIQKWLAMRGPQGF